MRLTCRCCHRASADPPEKGASTRSRHFSGPRRVVNEPSYGSHIESPSRLTVHTHIHTLIGTKSWSAHQTFGTPGRMLDLSLAICCLLPAISPCCFTLFACSLPALHVPASHRLSESTRIDSFPRGRRADQTVSRRFCLHAHFSFCYHTVVRRL